MRFLYGNEFDNYSLLFSSEHSSYPIENLQDYQLAKVWHSTGDTDEWVKIDAGEGKTITATGAAVLGHNLTTPGAICKIQGDNADDNWDGPPTVNETIAYNADIMTEYFTSASLRYWRFHFADGDNPDEHISVGRLVLCVYLETSAGKDMSIGYRDTSSVDESLTGQSFGDERIIQKVYGFNFPYKSDTVRKAIVTMVENIKKVRPIVLVPDESSPTKVIPVYCRLSEDMDISYIAGYRWSGGLSFREVF